MIAKLQVFWNKFYSIQNIYFSRLMYDKKLKSDLTMQNSTYKKQISKKFFSKKRSNSVLVIFQSDQNKYFSMIKNTTTRKKIKQNVYQIIFFLL